jgi:hypothetical protein
MVAGVLFVPVGVALSNPDAVALLGPIADNGDLRAQPSLCLGRIVQRRESLFVGSYCASVQKPEPHSKQPRYILTEQGVGCRLVRAGVSAAILL